MGRRARPHYYGGAAVSGQRVWWMNPDGVVYHERPYEPARGRSRHQAPSTVQYGTLTEAVARGLKRCDVCAKPSAGPVRGREE